MREWIPWTEEQNNYLLGLKEKYTQPNGRVSWERIATDEPDFLQKLGHSNLKVVGTHLSTLTSTGKGIGSKRPAYAERLKRIAVEYSLVLLDSPFTAQTDLIAEALRRAGEHVAVSTKLRKDLKDIVEQEWKQLMDGHSIDFMQQVPVVIEKPSEPQVIDVAMVLNEAPLPELCSIAVRRFVEHLQAASLISKAVVPATQPAKIVVQPQVEAKKDKKTKIIVLGMRPSDHRIITDKLHTRKLLQYIDVRCIENSMTPSNELPSADFVIVSRFCRHSGWDKMREKYGNDYVQFVSGGTSSIVEKIEELAKR